MWEAPGQKGLEGMKEEGREWIHGLLFLLFSRWIWQIFARSAKQKKEGEGGIEV